MAQRKKAESEIRKPRNLTLNPRLVERVLEVGAALGESRLSVLVDRALEEYLQRHATDAQPPAKSKPRHK